MAFHENGANVKTWWLSNSAVDPLVVRFNEYGKASVSVGSPNNRVMIAKKPLGRDLEERDAEATLE